MGNLKEYSAYTSYTGASASISYPQVSYVDDKNKVFFTHSNYMVVTYNVTSITESTRVLGENFNLSQVSTMLVDGKKIDSPFKEYRFNTTGIHKVRVIFKPSFTDATDILYDTPCFVDKYIDKVNLDQILTNKEDLINGGGAVTLELYEWVDLGLPSGLKWAAWNVGATKPEEFGLYFAWGETQGYTGITDEKKYTWADYKWSSDAQGTTMTKYNATDGLTTLEASDDATYATDSSCRMPTSGECVELTANTTSEWVDDYIGTGVAGRIFTSNVNGNSIFVPAAGYCSVGSVFGVGQRGPLWSSSLYSSDVRDAYSLVFDSSIVGVGSDYDRGYAFPIRAVKE